MRMELVTKLSDLVKLQSLFKEGFEMMNRRKKSFEIDFPTFIKGLLHVVNLTNINKGGVLVVYDDSGIPFGFSVALEDTPLFSDRKQLLIWASYVRNSREHPNCVKYMFNFACNYARTYGFSDIKTFNSRFNASSYRLFEDKLGMTKTRIQFTKNLWEPEHHQEVQTTASAEQVQ